MDSASRQQAAQRVALTDRASMDKDERQRKSVPPYSADLRSRGLAMTRRSLPRGAAGGRSSNNNIISVRRERPSASVRPQPDSVTGQQPRSAARGASGSRRQRVGLDRGSRC